MELLTEKAHRKRGKFLAENAYMSAASSDREGYYKPLRWQDIFFRLYRAEEVESVVVCKASRVGATKTGIALCLLTLASNGNAVWFDPTFQSAREFGQTAIKPIVETSPYIRANLTNTAKNRKAGRNTFSKLVLDDGSSLTVRHVKGASMRSIPAKLIVLDEYSSVATNVRGGTEFEGNPLQLASARMINAELPKLAMAISTPTIVNDVLWNDYQKAPVSLTWRFTCPHCGEATNCALSRLVWDSGKPNAVDFACEHCGALIAEKQAKPLIQAGEWYTHEKLPLTSDEQLAFRVALKVPLILNPAVSWKTISRNHELAFGEDSDLASKQAFTNTFAGEWWQSASGLIDAKELQRAAKRIPLIKVREDAYRISAVDVQGNRLEVLTIQVRRDAAALQVLGHESLTLDTSDLRQWKQLDECFRRVGTDFAAIDCGYLPDIVGEYSRGCDLPVQLVRGAASKRIDTHWFAGEKLMIGTDAMKDFMFQRLKGGSHYEFHSSLSKQFYEQLCQSEIRTAKGWRKVTEKASNEALDLMVYATALAIAKEGVK